MRQNRKIVVDKAHDLVGKRVEVVGNVNGQILACGVVDRIERDRGSAFAYLVGQSAGWSIPRLRVVGSPSTVEG